MKKCFVLSICFLLLGTFISKTVAAENVIVYRYFTHPSLSNSFITNIVLQGNILHVAKFKHWLNAISLVPHGRKTLKEIVNSSHKLTITSKRSARVSAGRTIAAMTEKLINGEGDDVEIWFDGSILESGSHMVYNSQRKLVEYTAIENLFHELVHAKHKMKGTWLYFDSEGQAIREENIFRSEYNKMLGKPPNERTYKTGKPVESIAGYIFPACNSIYTIRASPPVTFQDECGQN